MSRAHFGHHRRRLFLLLILGLLPKIGYHFAIGHQSVLFTVERDRLGLNPVSTLPHRDPALVTDVPVAVGGLHSSRLREQGLIA